MRNLYTLLLFIISLSIFSQQNVEDDFEGNGTITSWFGDDCSIKINFANPFKTGINTSAKVLKYTDSGGQYANIRFDVPVNFDLATNNTFSIKIYVPSASITGTETKQISLKLQDGKIGAPWSTQSEIKKSIVLDQWQTIAFSFANDAYINLDPNSQNPINRTDFNRVLLQVNGENNNSHVTAYIDDFKYDGTLNTNNSSGTDPVFDNLVWSDEFDGSGAINATKWHHQTIPIINGQNWANGEIQHYTDKTTNSYTSNGTLKIVGKKENYTFNGVTKNYTSARLNSKFAFTYGKVEIKAKMPIGIGTFPALWMLGQNITETGGYWAQTHGSTGWPDCGEVDIIEHWGTNQDFVQSALHNRSSFGNTSNKGGRKISNASTAFHIYTLEWNANKMIFSVDGIQHYIYNPKDKNIQNWPYNAPQYILFNFAILPSIDANFTQSALEIDYIRVYQESVAAVSKFDNLLAVKLFPNPVENRLTLQFSSDLGEIRGTIFNVTGQQIQNFTQKEIQKTIDVSHLSKGVYFLKLQSPKGTISHKFVKK